MKILDLKGKACPLPIILTKKEIANSNKGDIIEVFLDNEISKCNLEAYLKECGISFTKKSDNNEHVIRFCVGEFSSMPDVKDEVCEIKQKSLGDYVIVFSGDQMGQGEADLGRILVRSYINALKELESLPKKILFYNSGVKLLSKDIDTAESLNELCTMGIDIIACGVCVEYYKVKLGAGRISNMFVIGNTLAEASKVIYP